MTEVVARVSLLSLHTSPLAQPGTGDSGGMNVYVRELVAAHPGQSLALVAHAGVNRIILCEALSLPLEHLFLYLYISLVFIHVLHSIHPSHCLYFLPLPSFPPSFPLILFPFFLPSFLSFFPAFPLNVSLFRLIDLTDGH